MITDILFHVSAIFFAVPFSAKQIIHVYLDYKNGHKMYFGGMRQFKYFRKYDEDVTDYYLQLKALCNVLHTISMFLLWVLFVALLIKLIT